jgi:hypothetical protein
MATYPVKSSKDATLVADTVDTVKSEPDHEPRFEPSSQKAITDSAGCKSGRGEVGEEFE